MYGIKHASTCKIHMVSMNTWTHYANSPELVQPFGTEGFTVVRAVLLRVLGRLDAFGVLMIIKTMMRTAMMTCMILTAHCKQCTKYSG